MSSRAKPKGALWLVVFNGECRNIGSGQRLVEVLSIGPKWVSFRYKSVGESGYTYVRNRIKRELWDRRLAGRRPPRKL